LGRPRRRLLNGLDPELIYVDRQNAAGLVGVSRNTIDYWKRDGRLAATDAFPESFYGRRRVMYRLSDVLAAASKRKE